MPTVTQKNLCNKKKKRKDCFRQGCLSLWERQPGSYQGGYFTSVGQKITDSLTYGHIPGKG